MNYFLDHKDHDMLVLLSTLRAAMYYNSNGNKVSGKMLLLGENTVKFVSCGMYTSVRGNKYLALEFKRNNANVMSLATPVTFAPCYEYVFNEEGAIKVFSAFNHEQKKRKPDDMPMEVYLNGVGKRLGTFVGKEIPVWVNYTQIPRKDNYGFTEQRITGFNKTEDATVWRQEISFKEMSWEEICYKTLGYTCESENEIVNLQNK